MLQTLMSWLQAHLAPPTGRAVTGLMCGMQHSGHAGEGERGCSLCVGPAQPLAAAADDCCCCCCIGYIPAGSSCLHCCQPPQQVTHSLRQATCEAMS